MDVCISKEQNYVMDRFQEILDLGEGNPIRVTSVEILSSDNVFQIF